MGKAPNLDDYVDVRERMAEFFAQYPQGSFQSDPQFTQVDERWVVIVKAYAYRDPTDTRPGTGLAYEFIPGKTPYTKESELQNAETAAWGRAVIAVGAADSKKPIASREEVRNRTADELPDNVIDNMQGRQALRDLCEKSEPPLNQVKIAALFQSRFGKPAKTADNDELLAFINLYKTGAILSGTSE